MAGSGGRRGRQPVKLYSYYRSSAAYRVRIALEIKGIPYELAATLLRRADGQQHSPGYRAVNPQGLVPALEHGALRIGQSLAIIEYLEETHPQPPLLPGGPDDRARIRSLALAIACDIHPLNNLRVLTYLEGTLGQDEAAVSAWYRHWVSEGFRGLELEVQRYSAHGRYCYADELTLADVCLVPQIYNARRFGVPLEPFPTLRAITQFLERLPAFERARPEAQPDAPVAAVALLPGGGAR
jgi:maleylacetoacetate isomerase